MKDFLTTVYINLGRSIFCKTEKFSAEIVYSEADYLCHTQTNVDKLGVEIRQRVGVDGGWR